MSNTQEVAAIHRAGSLVTEHLTSQEVSLSTAAALCFLIYDMCLTTHLELTYIWGTPWASSKPLYFVARYYSLMALIMENAYNMTCREWIIMESVSILILELAVQMLLILRLFAIYLGSRIVTRVMIAAYVIQAIVMVICVGLSVPGIVTSNNCLQETVPIEMVIYCVVSIVFETFLFALTVTRYVRARRQGLASMDLLSILVRDGVLAFGVICAAMVMNAVFFTLGRKTITTAGFPWLLAILGVAGSRLVLNVREASRVETQASSLEGFEVSSAMYRALDQSDHEDDAEVLKIGTSVPENPEVMGRIILDK